MRDIVLAHVPVDRDIRLLDLGCGTGSLVVRLARALPAARLVGVDVSAANIEAARRNLMTAGPSVSPNVQFEVADYLELETEPFDTIVADGVMHLIPGDTVALVEKLARDLRIDGLLICSMPFDSAYNRVFAAVRRLLRMVRGPWLDRAILRAGRTLHGSDMGDKELRERVGYMYRPPERTMDDALARAFWTAGLHVVAEYPMESTSLSQLEHRVTVFVKKPVGG